MDLRSRSTAGRRRTYAAFALAGITLLADSVAGGALADVTDSGQHVLQLKFKQGETFKYQTSMKLGVGLPRPGSARIPQGSGSPGGASGLNGSTFTVSATQDVKVRKAGPNGGGELDVVTTGQNSLPGQPPVLTNDTRPVVMVYDAQGKLTSVRRQSESASSNPMFSSMLGQGLMCLQGVVLPSKPVRVGESWTEQIKIPGVTGSGASSIKTTLVRIEYLNKYRTAHLRVVITTPVSAYLDAALQPTAKAAEAACTATGTATVTSEVQFAIAEGRVIRSTGKGLTNMTVVVGKPAIPDKTATTRKKKGAAPAPAAPPARPSQTLKLTVTSDIESNLSEPKKLLGAS